MEILIFLIISYFLLCFTLKPLFEKAGVDGKKAWIPGINFAEMARLVGRKGRFALLLLVPIVGFFIFAGLCYDLVRSFGKHEFGPTAWAVAYAPFIFWKLGKDDAAKYTGPVLQQEAEYYGKMQAAEAANNVREFKNLQLRNPYEKPQWREWIEAIVFAVFAAAFIRMFFIEAYNIPTSSMEGSLMVGDYLFVSKAHYGVRTPKTIAMIPLLHNQIPGIGTESYLEEPDIPWTRLPAIEEMDYNKPFVFNYPMGDSVYVCPGRTWSAEDYRLGTIYGPHAASIKNGQTDLVTRPFDKTDFYVKRINGMPGDTFEIRNKDVYINGKPLAKPTNLQYRYIVTPPAGSRLNQKDFAEWGISKEDGRGEENVNRENGSMNLVLSQPQIDKIKAMDPNIQVVPMDYEGLIKKNDPTGIRTFPHDPKHFGKWTVDNFGPMWIPAKGATVDIKPSNIKLYERIINVYEDNDFERRGNKFFINGEEATTYTFKQDYYWGMGDNRHGSEDSRTWGFIPHSHVMGKPLFIWFSTREGNFRNGIRWNRIFTGATKM